MARLPQSEYPVDDMSLLEAAEKAKRIFFEIQERDRKDIEAEAERNRSWAEIELDELRQAVRDYFSTRSPQAEHTLKRLVGLDASITFTEEQE